MKKQKKIIHIGLALIFVCFGYFQANSSSGPIEEKNFGKIKYLTGGVGSDEREELKSMAMGYNLKLIFAKKNGNYLAGIGVAIYDSEGGLIFDATSEGPWFFVKMPAGKYKISSTYADYTITKNVKIDLKSKRIFFHF